MKIVFNSDLGESPALASSGTQREILKRVQLANVCCAQHAGNPELTQLTMNEVAAAGVRAGAHPGYPDREHFGRRSMFKNPFSAQDIVEMVAEQVAFARDAAKAAGLALYHVKAHGALYNEAAADGEVAEAIAQGVRLVARDVFLVGLADSVMVGVFRRQGFVVLREAFADRRYNSDGLLVPRNQPNAMITDPNEARQQMGRLAKFSDTVCVHSDSPNVLKILDGLI